MNTQSQTRANPGLEGIVAAETALSLVDGERGEPSWLGHALEELAQHDFEDVVALLWNAAGRARRRARRRDGPTRCDAGAARATLRGGVSIRWTHCAWRRAR